MSSWSELLDHAQPEEHLVQLYGRDDQLLTRNVSRYLAQGLRAGDGLVVIATSDHAQAIIRQLAGQSSETTAAMRDGRLLVLDARATLDRFLVDGSPDRELFLKMVGGALEEVRSRSLSGRIRAFGEMVGLLWVEEEYAAAARLEEYWNDLLKGSRISLYCAYPIDCLEGESQPGTLDAVLASHTYMCAGPRTVLSSPRAARYH